MTQLVRTSFVKPKTTGNFSISRYRHCTGTETSVVKILTTTTAQYNFPIVNEFISRLGALGVQGVLGDLGDLGDLGEMKEKNSNQPDCPDRPDHPEDQGDLGDLGDLCDFEKNIMIHVRYTDV